jgi:hypothetical protein
MTCIVDFRSDLLSWLQTCIRRHPINRGAQIGNPLAPAFTGLGRPIQKSSSLRAGPTMHFISRRLASSGQALRIRRDTVRHVLLLATVTVARLNPRRCLS